MVFSEKRCVQEVFLDIGEGSVWHFKISLGAVVEAGKSTNVADGVDDDSIDGKRDDDGSEDREQILGKEAVFGFGRWCFRGRITTST